VKYGGVMGQRAELDPLGVLLVIIRIFASTGSCSQADIAQAMGASKAGVRYRVHQLVEMGAIVNQRDRIRPHYPRVEELGVVRLLVRASADDGVTASIVTGPESDIERLGLVATPTPAKRKVRAKA
jgi:DNA-binding Lrp family transcriptional regulator